MRLPIDSVFMKIIGPPTSCSFQLVRAASLEKLYGQNDQKNKVSTSSKRHPVIGLKMHEGLGLALCVVSLFSAFSDRTLVLFNIWVKDLGG